MILDVIYLISLLLFTIRGYSKGIVVALFSVVAIVLGGLGALKLSQSISALLFSDTQHAGKWAPLLSYIIVFLLIVWSVRLLAKWIQKSMEAVTLGWLNKLCGALLYAFLVTFIFSSLLWLFNKMGLINPDTKSMSKTFDIVEPLAPQVFTLIGVVLPFAKNVFSDLSLFFDQVNHKLR